MSEHKTSRPGRDPDRVDETIIDLFLVDQLVQAMQLRELPPDAERDEAIAHLHRLRNLFAHGGQVHLADFEPYRMEISAAMTVVLEHLTRIQRSSLGTQRAQAWRRQARPEEISDILDRADAQRLLTDPALPERQPVELTGPGGQERVLKLLGLARGLLRRSKRTSATTDLREARTLLEEAQTLAGGPHHPQWHMVQQMLADASRMLGATPVVADVTDVQQSQPAEFVKSQDDIWAPADPAAAIAMLRQVRDQADLPRLAALSARALGAGGIGVAAAILAAVRGSRHLNSGLNISDFLVHVWRELAGSNSRHEMSVYWEFVQLVHDGSLGADAAAKYTDFVRTAGTAEIQRWARQLGRTDMPRVELEQFLHDLRADSDTVPTNPGLPEGDFNVRRLFEEEPGIVMQLAAYYCEYFLLSPEEAQPLSRAAVGHCFGKGAHMIDGTLQKVQLAIWGQLGHSDDIPGYLINRGLLRPEHQADIPHWDCGHKTGRLNDLR